jgi:Tol biopolymer transport system component
MRRSIPLVVALSTALVASPLLLAGHDLTTCASVNPAGHVANLGSQLPALSSDGRFVAFESGASDLVANDTNARSDIFVRDRRTGVTTRESVDSYGNQADDNSYHATISADGRVVAFVSIATNLVPGDVTGHEDVFVHDRQTGATVRASVDSNGTAAILDTDFAAISADGSAVVFVSRAPNLVAGDTNNRRDVFVHDLATGATTRVSVSSSGSEGDGECDVAAISADGRYVAFDSWSSNLVAGDTNGTHDVFVHDRSTGQTERVSVDSNGNESDGDSLDPSISADGRWVAFDSASTNLVSGDTIGVTDVFLHDRQTGATTRISTGLNGAESNGISDSPKISADGVRIAFESSANNLVQGKTTGWQDVYVYDGATGVITRESVSSAGAEADDHCYLGAISADGRIVTFFSFAFFLVPNDTNRRNDVFLRGPEFTLEAEPSTVSAGQTLTLTTFAGVPGNGASTWAVDVSGTPIFVPIALGAVQSDGTFGVAAIVPPGLSSLDVTFRSYCIGEAGFLEHSNDATVVFQ